MDRKPGDVLGDWVLRELVGPGPDSELWKASHRDDPSRAAAVRFFITPVRVKLDALRGLDHPNIARVQEVAPSAQEPFLRRDWAEGVPLDPRSLSFRDAGRAAGQVLHALAYAHGKGVGHGRLGSSNVVLAPGGRVTVCDFGLSGAAADPRGDLRALGELLRGSGLEGAAWLERLRSGGFATADEALAALPSPAPMPSWIAGPMLIVGVFFVAYVALGITMAGLQPALRLIAGAVGAALCAVAWRHIERPLPAAVFWGAVLWGFGARSFPWPAPVGAAAVAFLAGALWVRARGHATPAA